MSSTHPIRDRQLELGAGVLLFLAGVYLIRDAYEGRDRKRGFIAHVVLP